SVLGQLDPRTELREHLARVDGPRRVWRHRRTAHLNFGGSLERLDPPHIELLVPGAICVPAAPTGSRYVDVPVRPPRPVRLAVPGPVEWVRANDRSNVVLGVAIEDEEPVETALNGQLGGPVEHVALDAIARGEGITV